MLAIGKQLTVEQRLSKAVVDIMGKAHALAGVIMIGERVVDDTVPTACTNGRDEKYGRAFVESLNDPELRFLILHEVYHKLYRHLTTWKHLYNQDAQLSNVACDHVINLKITDEFAKDGWVKMPDGGCFDVKYRGWDTAQVFKDLQDNNSGDDGEGDDGGDGGFDAHDWEGAQDMSAEEQRELARDIDEAVRQGALIASKLGSGGVRNLEDLLQPQVDWREVLREFVQNTCAGSDYSTWKRPNRRYMGAGIYMPSGVSDKVGELVIAIDTSGSIGGKELTAFLSEVTSICETRQ
jgi:predicted metal-dependent peptidase